MRLGVDRFYFSKNVRDVKLLVSRSVHKGVVTHTIGLSNYTRMRTNGYQEKGNETLQRDKTRLSIFLSYTKQST